MDQALMLWSWHLNAVNSRVLLFCRPLTHMILMAWHRHRLSISLSPPWLWLNFKLRRRHLLKADSLTITRSFPPLSLSLSISRPLSIEASSHVMPWLQVHRNVGCQYVDPASALLELLLQDVHVCSPSNCTITPSSIYNTNPSSHVDWKIALVKMFYVRWIGMWFGV